LEVATDRLAGIETNENLKPTIVRVHNGWQIGFLVDAFNDGHVAVFIPGAPDPSSGVVQIISSDKHAWSTPDAAFQTFWGSS
jgi:hypothetical protein